MVAAAFIGPGTVTVCTMAGVQFGYDLLWALLLSLTATAVLQEMAARIGLISQKGLPELIRSAFHHRASKMMALGLVIVAIVLGNAAYEAGNISGAVMGLETFFPTFSSNQAAFRVGSLMTGVIAWSLLMTGSYKRVEQVMVVIVLVMSLVFLVTACMAAPSIPEILAGFVPSVTPSNILTIVSLVGTTVVPYNMFLHASLVSKKWTKPAELGYVRADTFIAVFIGCLVSMAIVVTGAASASDSIQSVTDLAKSLEPLLGEASLYFLGTGLFAAGITSALTAPLAGALVICGCFGWNDHLASSAMRWSFSLILLLGIFFASLGIKPVHLITIAQLANGILLPVLSTFILWLVNDKRTMHAYTNHFLANFIALAIWVITWVLGAKSIFNVFEKWQLWF